MLASEAVETELSVRFSLGLQASSAFSLFDPLDPRTYVDIGRGQRRAQLIQNRNTRGKADVGKAEGVTYQELLAPEMPLQSSEYILDLLTHLLQTHGL